MRPGGGRLLALALGLAQVARGETATLDVACPDQADVTIWNDYMQSTCQGKTHGVGTTESLVVAVQATKLTMNMDTNASNIIEELTLTGAGSSTPQWIGYATPLSFTTMSKLKNVTLQRIAFQTTDITMELPSTVAQLSIEDVDLTELSLQNYSNTLTKIAVTGTNFSQVPRFLYEREYGANVDIDVDLSSVNGSMDMSSENFKNLQSNLKLTEAYASSSCMDNGSSSGNAAVSCDFSTSSTTEAPTTSPQLSRTSNHTSSSSGSGSGAEADAGSSGGGVSTGALVAIIVIVVVIALVLAYFITRIYFRRKAANAGTQNDATATLMNKSDASGDKGSFISNDEFLRNFRLPQSDVSLVKSVGTGRLWMGEYNEGKVIVKRVESEVTDSYVTKALMAQARTFATISHPNITSLVGVTWLAGTDFAVVTEFMDKGNLKTVLSNSDLNLDVSTKLQMCLDVAQALAYLHETEQNLCSKQLSSRKVVVNKAMTCKLSLFECVPCSTKLGGPSTAATYSYGMGEVAWLPPEIITRSSPMDARKNNIYAFGVIVSEIFTRVSPYQTLIEEQGNTMSDVELVQRVRRQELMVPHENRREYLEAPVSVRQLVEQCLSYAPMSRPTAKDLVDCLRSAKEELQTNNI